MILERDTFNIKKSRIKSLMYEKINNTITYLFMAMLGLCCFAGFSLVVVHGLLIAVASLVAEQGSRVGGLSSCGTWA